MPSFATTALLGSVMVSIALAQPQPLIVNSVNGLITCEPSQISWTGGTPPYYIEMIPGGQAGAPALKQFPQQNASPLTWTVDLPAGTSVTTSLKDITGQVVYSGIQPIQNGSDTSCLSTAVSVSVSGASATSAASGATTSSAATPGFAVASTTASASRSATSASVSGSHSSTSSAAQPTQTQSGNGAARSYTVGAIGAAGIVGLIGFFVL